LKELGLDKSPEANKEVETPKEPAAAPAPADLNDDIPF
jgi:hypothetical protein